MVDAPSPTLQALFDGLGLGVVVTDRQGRIRDCNPAFCELLGRDLESLTGAPLEACLHADDARGVAHAAPANPNEDEGARAARLAQEARDVRLIRGDGQTVFARKRELPNRAGDGAVVHTFERLEPADAAPGTSADDGPARLLLSDRRSAVGTLAAGMAHDINNPLAYVLSNISFAVEEIGRRSSEPVVQNALGEDLSAVLEALSDAREGAERVERIVRDLRAFSDSNADTREPVDPRRAVQLATSLAGSQIRHRAHLVVDQEEVANVAASEGRLCQVVLNLLLNAAQAIPEGAVAKHVVRVSTRMERGEVTIRVSDTGTGIPAHVREHLFDAFYTTKPVGVGAGLGLFVARHIVQELGGTLTLDSDVGRGTTVTLRLPAVQKTEARSSKPPAKAPTRRGRVLVIDDEALVGSSLRRNLIKEHDVLTVTRAAEGLDLLERGERFDVIFCDLMMPDVSGMDFFDEVERHYPDLASRVVFLTGGAFTPHAATFFERVPNERLEKPTPVDVIRTLVRRRLASSQP